MSLDFSSRLMTTLDIFKFIKIEEFFTKHTIIHHCNIRSVIMFMKWFKPFWISREERELLHLSIKKTFCNCYLYFSPGLQLPTDSLRALIANPITFSFGTNRKLILKYIRIPLLTTIFEVILNVSIQMKVVQLYVV